MYAPLCTGVCNCCMHSGKTSTKASIDIKEMKMECKLNDKQLAQLQDGSVVLEGDFGIASAERASSSGVKSEFPSLKPLKEGIKVSKSS